MGYLGSTYTTFDPTRTIATPRDADRFTGDGSTTTFTLSRTVDSPTDVEVFVENVQQEPLVAYTITGTSLIFTEAPKAPFTSTTNIYVVYRAFNSNITVTLPDGVVTSSKLATNIRLFTVDNFTANGSATSFALSDTPASANTLIVAVNGVLQTTPNNFTVSGSTLTFTSAPAANANVTIRHLGYRSTTTLTAIPANTTITQPTLSNPTITLAGSTSYKANADFYDSTGTTLVGNVSTYSSNSMAITANTTLDFRTNNTTRMLVDSSGNVGIGTSSPGYRLEVKGPSATAGQLSIHDGTGDTTVSGNTAVSLLFQARDTNIRTIAEIDAVHTTTNGTGAAMVFQTRISDTLAERMRIDSSGNLLFNSGYGSVATAYGCRAWVNFNGTGTVAIRASGNVTSITDNGTGYYTVNFTNAMPDVNYAVVATCQHYNGVTKQAAVSGANLNAGVGSCDLFTWYNSGDFDSSVVCVSVFR